MKPSTVNSEKICPSTGRISRGTASSAMSLANSKPSVIAIRNATMITVDCASTSPVSS